MPGAPLLSSASVFLAHALAFGAAGLACLASVVRARRIEDDDTRRGLVWLLLLSGAWGLFHVLFLLAPTPGLQLLAYHAGLIVGMATVGPWLYFCSAYSGRSIHRSPTVRRLAVSVFLVIVILKLTNPVHGLYFGAEVVASPFPHLAVDNGTLHWLAMGLAYALATVGYFMLLELLWQVDHGTGPLLALIGITGLPLVLDIVGSASPLLLDITYEPLGVAAFAVGSLFLFAGQFQAIQIAGRYDGPTVLLDDENRVRDYNAPMEDLFPELEVGAEIEAIFPEVAGSLDDEHSVVTIRRHGGVRYYLLSTNPFSTDLSRRGRIVTLADVTEREQYRRKLERQNERLERFASTVSHDLRNPLNVASGRVDLARGESDSEHLAAATAAHDRMEEIIESLLALARQGQPIDETDPVGLADLAERAWRVVDTGDADLVVDRDLTFAADEDRVQQLVENLFRNSLDHAGPDVTVSVGALDGEDGFFVADDGPGIPPEDRTDVLESGYTTDEEGTGFGLAIVAEIAEAHGWEVAVTESAEGGARFEFAGVDTSADAADAPA